MPTLAAVFVSFPSRRFGGGKVRETNFVAIVIACGISESVSLWSCGLVFRQFSTSRRHVFIRWGWPVSLCVEEFPMGGDFRWHILWT